MPTYKNSTSEHLTVDDYVGEKVVFNPNQQKTTLKILDNANLELISNEPFYNFLLDDQTYSMATSAASASHDVDPSGTTIRLVPLTGNPTVYINNWNNTPGCVLHEITEITNRGRVERLYFLGTGSVNVKELK